MMAAEVESVACSFRGATAVDHDIIMHETMRLNLNPPEMLCAWRRTLESCDWKFGSQGTGHKRSSMKATIKVA
jgi:hypothetical protein